MDRSFFPTEWKPQETTGKRWQAGLSVTEQVPRPEAVELELIERSGFSKALSDAAMQSGMDNYQIADAIHISHGYMCKFMRGVGEQWAKRLVAFMRKTKSLAPLVWLADQMGCDVVVRHKMSAELMAAYSKIQEYEREHGRLIA
ncbi:hypothetical protein [Variovorax atrisoli]|uniref:hypothetical protein n=1 Tax=Variovorax atrisoli TaxID=3394203 RepID=UPI0012FE776D|nr:hypothetical protein [Variovorax paradoxus]